MDEFFEVSWKKQFLLEYSRLKSFKQKGPSRIREREGGFSFSLCAFLLWLANPIGVHTIVEVKRTTHNTFIQLAKRIILR